MAVDIIKSENVGGLALWYELIPATEYECFCRTFNFRTKWPHTALFEDDATEESITHTCAV